MMWQGEAWPSRNQWPPSWWWDGEQWVTWTALADEKGWFWGIVL